MEPVDYISENLKKSGHKKLKGMTARKDITGRVTTVKYGKEKYTIVKFGGK